MIEAGRKDEIPTRKFHKKSKSVSVNAKISRDSNGWRTNVENVSDNKKRIMIALMLKIAILVMMESTCYTFGGKIYRQSNGAGIGLRGSTCVAKLVMGVIDRCG